MNIVEMIELTVERVSFSRAILPALVTGIVYVVWFFYALSKKNVSFFDIIVLPFLLFELIIIGSTVMPKDKFPTGEVEYHVELIDMTPQELSEQYGEIWYEDGYWVYTVNSNN